MEHVHVRDNFWEPVLSSHYMCHWDQTQVTRLESKHLYSPSPLTGPHNFCISILFGLLVLSCGFSDVSPCSGSTSSFNSFAQIEASWPCHQIIHFSCITLCVRFYLKCIIFLCLTCSHDSVAWICKMPFILFICIYPASNMLYNMEYSFNVVSIEGRRERGRQEGRENILKIWISEWIMKVTIFQKELSYSFIATMKHHDQGNL